MRPTRWFFLFVLAILFAAACTKKADGITGPAGPAGTDGSSTQTGKSAITGFVNLVDQYGQPLTDYFGATVSTQNGSNAINANTDSNGRFALPSLSPGNYDIVFKKSGYDSLKVYVQHSGGNEDKFIGIVKLNQHLTTQITSEDISLIPGPYYPNDPTLSVQTIINFDGPVMGPTTRRDFAMYFSASTQVGSTLFDVSMNTQDYSTNTGTNSYPIQYSLANFTGRNISYPHGDTVYVKTYIMPVTGTLTTWFDYSSYQQVTYPYLGDSTVTYFIWP